jgi:hypothetical protein
MAFRAPRTGSYTIRLDYPRYRALSIVAVATFLLGLIGLTRWPRNRHA